MVYAKTVFFCVKLHQWEPRDTGLNVYAPDEKQDVHGVARVYVKILKIRRWENLMGGGGYK